VSKPKKNLRCLTEDADLRALTKKAAKGDVAPEKCGGVKPRGRQGSKVEIPGRRQPVGISLGKGWKIGKRRSSAKHLLEQEGGANRGAAIVWLGGGGENNGNRSREIPERDLRTGGGGNDCGPPKGKIELNTNRQRPAASIKKKLPCSYRRP